MTQVALVVYLWCQLLKAQVGGVSNLKWALEHWLYGDFHPRLIGMRSCLKIKQNKQTTVINNQKNNPNTHVCVCNSKGQM